MVMNQMLTGFVTDGMLLSIDISIKRVSHMETEPQPTLNPHEWVLLASLIEQGFLVPVHDFV